MKYAVLKALTAKLQSEHKIVRIARVADSVLKVEFEKNGTYHFDLTRGHNFVFKNESFLPKNYYAPFDVALAKHFSRCNVEKIELSNTDKIITIHVSVKLGYKEQKACLVLELTGKNANTVVTDENEIVLSALRYEVGARELRIGQKLLLPPPPPFAFSEVAIDDVDVYLEGLSNSKQKNRLEHLKNQKIAQIDKKIEKLDDVLHTLEEPQVLEAQAEDAKKIGDLLCTNAHEIVLHQDSITLQDFDGNSVNIELPPLKSQKELLNFFYQKSKKLKKKAEGYTWKKPLWVKKKHFC